jgi:hypothetical protein
MYYNKLVTAYRGRHLNNNIPYWKKYSADKK